MVFPVEKILKVPLSEEIISRTLGLLKIIRSFFFSVKAHIPKEVRCQKEDQ